MNAIGGCCGTSPEHIAAIREMALAYPARPRHSVPAQLRLSGLEPLNYAPDEGNMRSTFLNIGERCNVAGSIIYKKAIVAGDYDKAASIALSQVGDLAALAGGLIQGVWEESFLNLPGPCTSLQVGAGADVLDINMDDGLIDGVPAMTRFVNLLVSDPEASRVPFMIDSSKFFIIEAGLKCCQASCRHPVPAAGPSLVLCRCCATLWDWD